MNCLIGYTGFVGSNILKNSKIIFHELYNTKNIENIGTEYDIIVFSGFTGNVGYANTNHQKDHDNLVFFMNKFKNIKCKLFILISSINVYPILNSKKTENEIIERSIDFYGKHRLHFENFIMKTYKNYSIIRLPSIYGNNMKKGILYDLLEKNFLENISLEDKFQFYDLSDLNNHIEYTRNNNIKILNLVTEPVSTKEIINEIFKNYKIINNNTIKCNNININLRQRPIKHLDICSQFFKNGYIYNSNKSKEKIKNFIQEYTLNK